MFFTKKMLSLDVNISMKHTVFFTLSPVEESKIVNYLLRNTNGDSYFALLQSCLSYTSFVLLTNHLILIVFKKKTHHIHTKKKLPAPFEIQ